MANETQQIQRDPADVPNQILVTVQESLTFDLRLPACMSCGYDWKVLNQNDSFLKSTSEELPNRLVEPVYTHRVPHPVGNNEIKVLHFPKLAAGTYQYRIEYGHPFEKDDPKPSVLVTVTVNK